MLVLYLIAMEYFTGGLGLGIFESSLVCEEFAFGCAGIKAALTITDVGVSILFCA